MRLAHLRASATLVVVWTLIALCHGPLLSDSLPGQLATGAVEIVCLTGFGLRMLCPRRHRWLILLAQTLALGMATVAVAWPSLTDGSWRAVAQTSMEIVQEKAAPLPEDPGLALVYALGIGLLALLSELFVFAAREPGYTIIPLSIWYGIYALLPFSSAPLRYLVLCVGGYAAILAVDTWGRGQRWSRHLAEDSGRHTSDIGPTVARVAAMMVTPTLLGAVLIGTLVPAPPMRLARDLDSGNVTLSDPRLDLRRNLKTNDTRVALRYSTNVPGGVRLQLATLDVFDRDGWRTGTMGLSRQGEGQVTLSRVPGLAQEPTTRHRTQVSIDQFQSNFLPVPYAPRVIHIQGSWGFDPGSLVVFSTAQDQSNALNRAVYDVESVPIEPTRSQLQHATVQGAPAGSTTVPSQLSPRVVELARNVTAHAKTPAEKAAALQSFLRGPNFTYDLNNAPDAEGVKSIEDFVLKRRSGYCEQFAGAMSAMARAVGLPSRVVIGFLPGQANRDGVFVVTNHEMHAWSEVWFKGWGWVRFDATPGIVSGDVPPWSPQVRVGSPTTSPTPTPTPSRTPSARPSATPTVTVEPTAAPTADRSFHAPGWLLPLMGGVVLLLTLASVPRLLRVSRRHRRLAASDPRELTLGAWAEVRDLVLDHGGSWPRESPRALADLVGKRFTDENDDRLWTLALAVERARFGRGLDAAPPKVAETVAGVEHELRVNESQWVRFRASWWPRSLWAG